ncbi:DUF1772 domain-containing protein [Nonomuraea antimicrobica]|uniref:DUF1772 domain-containing protein n=1 Tax=Nonomuraea antimicrobica TaxID=561173 RepID=A0ABP7DDQ1_9ACTN
MFTALLEVVAIVGSGIVAGVFLAIAVSVLPALRALPADRYIDMHRRLGKGYHPIMPLTVNGGMFADLVLVFLAPVPARYLFAAAFVLMLGTQGVSHLANVPINKRIHAMDPAALTPDWDDPRPLWQNWHLLRTVLAVAALAVNAAGAALAAS